MNSIMFVFRFGFNFFHNVMKFKFMKQEIVLGFPRQMIIVNSCLKKRFNFTSKESNIFKQRLLMIQIVGISENNASIFSKILLTVAYSSNEINIFRSMHLIDLLFGFGKWLQLISESPCRHLISDFHSR